VTATANASAGSLFRPPPVERTLTFYGQRGGNIDHGLAAGNEDLGGSAAQTVGALNRESALGPLSCPAEQRSGGAGVDDEAPYRELGARGVDG
jgi:hypothetical protein